jgi:hypothetical protein
MVENLRAVEDARRAHVIAPTSAGRSPSLPFRITDIREDG